MTNHFAWFASLFRSRKLPPSDAMTFPQKAVDLILESEGIDQPGKWPGGGSGITLGYGCDIGADPASLEFWRGILSNDQMTLLATAKGITGRAAAQIQTRFAGIRVSKEDSMKVFMCTSLPREITITTKAYPSIDQMPPEVLGAMTSIVYNRGAAMSGERRREMAAIRDIIALYTAGKINKNSALSRIASEIRSMKRLWVGQGLDGLLKRREAEAKLVESAIQA